MEVTIVWIKDAFEVYVDKQGDVEKYDFLCLFLKDLCSYAYVKEKKCWLFNIKYIGQVEDYLKSNNIKVSYVDRICVNKAIVLVVDNFYYVKLDTEFNELFDQHMNGKQVYFDTSNMDWKMSKLYYKDIIDFFRKNFLGYMYLPQFIYPHLNYINNRLSGKILQLKPPSFLRGKDVVDSKKQKVCD